MTVSVPAAVFHGNIALLGGILMFVLGTAIYVPALYAQESAPNGVEDAKEPAPNGIPETLEELPGLRERAVVMHMVSRIVEQNHQVVWNMESTKITIPGRPVGLKLVSSDIIVAVQFTPFLRNNSRHTLVAQGQIWVNVPNEGISYHTTMQTIPFDFQEQVYFFPLGSVDERDESHIEIQLMMSPLSERNPSINAGRDMDIPRGRDNIPRERERRNASP